MKICKQFFSILLIFIYSSFLLAQEVPVSNDVYDEVINATVLPFLEALKNGDVNLIKQYITEDMYETREVLFEQNEEYPEFLQEYYNGVQFNVDNAHGSGDYLIVHISIEYPNGDYGAANLYLCPIKDIAQGVHETKHWIICNFIND